MARIEFPIANGFYSALSGPTANMRCVNMYPAIPQNDAAGKKVLYKVPGTKSYATATTAIGAYSRGSIRFLNGDVYWVIGTSLYRVDSAGVATSVGTITGTHDVFMATNGINIAIVNPLGSSYFYNPTTNTLSEITDAVFISFGQCKGVAYKDGYYIFHTQTQLFSGSVKTTNDGKNFDALAFASAEVSPDYIVTIHVNHNQLYVFGTRTIEVFDTVETTTFPFARVNQAVIQKGCDAPHSPTEFDNSFIFIGGDENELPAIWRASGSSVQKISTSAIDQIIQKNSEETISNARVSTYSKDGGFFAVVTIGDRTFVYDATASAGGGYPHWHERQSGVTDGDTFQAWNGVHLVEAFGKVLVGDATNGDITYLDTEAYTENGERMECLISTRPLLDKLEYIYHEEVELFMETGVGNADDPDPIIRFDYSDDGGKTYSSEVQESMGKIGEYRRRVLWDRLGDIDIAREMRFKTTAKTKVNITSLFVNATKGTYE